MPIKRRIQKARHLTAEHIEMLRDGPAAMLLAGAGYLAAGPVSHFANATDEQRAAILDAMRTDWQRHSERLLAEGGDWWVATFDIDRQVNQP